MPSKYRPYLKDFEQWPFIYGFRFFIPAGAVSAFALITDNPLPVLADADFVWRAWSIDMSQTTNELVGLSPASSSDQIGIRFRLADGTKRVELDNAVNRNISSYQQVATFFGTAVIL